MRPGALTPAARSAATSDDAPRKTDRPRATRTGRDAPGERHVSRVSRPPRRLSGPAKGKGSATRPQTAARPPRPQTAARSSRPQTAARSSRPTRAPRGVFASGSAAIAAAVALPLRRPFIDRETAPGRAPRPVPAPKPAKTAKAPRGILRGLGAFVVALPDHLWFDKMVRGRAWIPLLGVLLAGIVAAQVEILKLGASIGRSLEQTTTLTTQNEQLRYSVASLSNDQRIERLATSMGMVLPPAGSVGYIGASLHGDVTRALGNIHAPDATGFMALAPTNGALVTGAGTSMLPTTPGVLAQAGTPGSATPTSTPSPTSTVPTAGAATSAATGTSGTSGTSTITATRATTSGTPTDTTPTQTPANSQTPTAATQTPTGSQTPTTATQTPRTQSAASTGTQSSSQAPATGAAAIQPAGGTQQSSGG